MGIWEDFWWDTHYALQNEGLKEAFDAQLKKMDGQEKHRYKDTRSRWSYALDKVRKQKMEKKDI